MDLVECGSCRATGLYRGFAEPEGVAVICLSCNGSGAVNRSRADSTPFTGRKHREGVHTVRRSAGAFIFTGVGPTGGSITYEQFKNGASPQ